MRDWSVVWAAGVAATPTVLWLVWQRRWAGGTSATPNPNDDPPMWPVLATGILLYLDGETMVSRNPAGTNHLLGLLAVAVGVTAITMAVGSVLMQERR
jgi:hypothetical protein